MASLARRRPRRDRRPAGRTRSSRPPCWPGWWHGRRRGNPREGLRARSRCNPHGARSTRCRARRSKMRSTSRRPAPRRRISSCRSLRRNHGSAGYGGRWRVRAVPVDLLEIGLRRRYGHIVMGRDVERPVAADAKVDAGRGDERLDPRLDQAGRRGWHRDGDIVRQAFALRRVEDGEALQEGDAPPRRPCGRAASRPPARSSRHRRRWCRARPCGHCRR